MTKRLKLLGWLIAGCCAVAPSAVRAEGEEKPYTTASFVAAIPKDRKPSGQEAWSKLLIDLAAQWAKENCVGKPFEGTMTVGKWMAGYRDEVYLQELYEMPTSDVDFEYQTIVSLTGTVTEPAEGAPGRRGERVKVTGTIASVGLQQTADRRVTVYLRLKDRKTEAVDVKPKTWAANELMADVPPNRLPAKGKQGAKWDAPAIDSWLRAKLVGSVTTAGKLLHAPKLLENGRISYVLVGKAFTAQGTTWRVDAVYTLSEKDLVKAIKRKANESVKVKGRIAGVSVSSSDSVPPAADLYITLSLVDVEATK